MSIELAAHCQRIAERARRASTQLALCSAEKRNEWLKRSATSLRQNVDRILEVNARDVAASVAGGLTAAQVDRLQMTRQSVEAMAASLDEIASFPDPIGEVMETSLRPNGLRVEKVRVPLGVILFIFESRPNVAVDAAALCVKSGNAVILRGGKEAAESIRALSDGLLAAAGDVGLPSDAIQVVPTADRKAVGHLLALDKWIDLVIPRGGESLIRRVAEEARMPVLKHYAGNCHVYVDRSADLAMAETITVNAKCQRVGVCNAAESLLVHRDVAGVFLPAVGAALGARGVEIRGDDTVCRLVPGAVPATDDDYAAEFLAPILSAKVVGSVEEAIEHVNRYGSRHTDAIVADDPAAAEAFARQVDSSAVMINASTRFNDGGELGLGAEIGISTDKLHARGPCGLRELTTYKYIVRGTGQIR